MVAARVVDIVCCVVSIIHVSCVGTSELAYECVVCVFSLCFFFFKPKTAYEIFACLVGSEMFIRDRFISTLNQCANRVSEAGSATAFDPPPPSPFRFSTLQVPAEENSAVLGARGILYIKNRS